MAFCFICSYHQQHTCCWHHSCILFKDGSRYYGDINSPRSRNRGHISGTSQRLSQSADPSFQANSHLHSCKAAEIWKAPYWNVLQKSARAVAETSWRALSSWKLELMFPGVPHALFCMPTLFFISQSSFLVLGGVHDPDQTSGMQVWITETSMGMLRLARFSPCPNLLNLHGPKAAKWSVWKWLLSVRGTQFIEMYL